MTTLKSELILSLVDKLTGPAKGVGNALEGIESAAKNMGKGASSEIQALVKSLREARDHASKFDLFERLNKDLAAKDQAFRKAQDDVKRLEKSLDDARKAAAKFDGVASLAGSS